MTLLSRLKEKSRKTTLGLTLLTSLIATTNCGTINKTRMNNYKVPAEKK